MDFSAIRAVLCMAPSPGAQGQGSSAPFLVQIFPLILMVVIFYFLLIRPQQRKAREHAEMLKTIKAGDKVVTSGGILGIIVGVRDKTVTIRTADTKLEILRSAVSEITERTGSSAGPEA